MTATPVEGFSSPFRWNRTIVTVATKMSNISSNKIFLQAYADRNLESRGFIPMVLEDSLGGLFIRHVHV